MPDFSTLIPSPYLTAADLPAEGASLTIARVEPIMMKGRGGAVDAKGLVAFTTGKPLVANKTNLKTIAQLLGRDYAGWIGRVITLYATTTQYGDETVPCVRVRLSIPAPPAAIPSPPPAAETAKPARARKGK